MSNMAAIMQNTHFNFNTRILLSRRTCYAMLERKPYTVPVPDVRHQAVSLKIAAGLLRHIEERKLGCVFQAPCNLILSGRIVVQPDIVFVGWKRKHIIRRTNLYGVPDLVVEITSRATRDTDLKAKKKIYARHEIPEYWIVDPENDSMETLVWSEMGYVSVAGSGKSDRLCTPLLPGLNLRLASVFRNI